MFTSFQQTISLRVVVGTIGLVGVFFLPWWVPIVCAVVLALRYAAFEIVVIGLLMDLTWFTADVGMYPFCAVGSVVLLWLLTPLREQWLTG